MNIQEFLKEVNALRLKSAGKWYRLAAIVEGKSVDLSGCGTWNRTFLVNGVRCGGLCDLSVAGWKKEIVEAVTHE